MLLVIRPRSSDAVRGAVRYTRKRFELSGADAQEPALHDGSSGEVCAHKSHRSGRLRRPDMCCLHRQVGDERATDDVLFASPIHVSALLRYVPRGTVQRLTVISNYNCHEHYPSL